MCVSDCFFGCGVWGLVVDLVRHVYVGFVSLLRFSFCRFNFLGMESRIINAGVVGILSSPWVVVVEAVKPRVEVYCIGKTIAKKLSRQ